MSRAARLDLRSFQQELATRLASKTAAQVEAGGARHRRVPGSYQPSEAIFASSNSRSTGFTT